MKVPTLLVLFVTTSTPHALADHPNEYAGLQPRSNKDGRRCDFTDGYYVDWSDCSLAAAKWCSAHAGQEVAKGKSIDDGNIAGYRSDHWHVELYVKFQNDHIDSWLIDEDACNWYLQYIAQGCTPGGDRPTNSGKQQGDGGTFYEPLMGSVDMKWVPTT